MCYVPEGKKCVEVRKYENGNIKIKETCYKKDGLFDEIKKMKNATLLFVPETFMGDELLNEKIGDAIKSYTGNSSDLSDLKESLEKIGYEL